MNSTSAQALTQSVEESLARFDGLQKLHQSNQNYKSCEQDENRVGVLDAQIAMADLKRLRALECPIRNGELQAFRASILADAQEQLEKAERHCVEGSEQRHYFGQARGCVVRGKIYEAQTFMTPTTLTEVAHNQEFLASVKEQWTQALSIFDELNETSSALECKAWIRRVDEELHFYEAIQQYSAAEGHGSGQVGAAFSEQDTTGSGTITVAQLGALTTQLGTSPPLKEEELLQLVQQMGYAPTKGASIAWDNFWLWWCTGEVLSNSASRVVS